MRVWTIGFTQKSAERFFGTLAGSGARRLVDVRLNNVSQLAGFTRRDDLAWFLRTICGMEYAHAPELAPTKAMLNAFRADGGDWERYAADFQALLAERRAEETTRRELIDGAVLLCSEPTPERCHRRLVAEYLAGQWGDLEIVHLT